MPHANRGPTATIKVVYRPSQFDQPVIIALDLDRRFWDLSPLPRDRELPWAGDAHHLAAQQQAERRQIANMVAQKLVPKIADAIVEHISAQDTIHGYSRQEWDQMRFVSRKKP